MSKNVVHKVEKQDYHQSLPVTLEACMHNHPLKSLLIQYISLSRTTNISASLLTPLTWNFAWLRNREVCIQFEGILMRIGCNLLSILFTGNINLDLVHFLTTIFCNSFLSSFTSPFAIWSKLIAAGTWTRLLRKSRPSGGSKNACVADFWWKSFCFVFSFFGFFYINLNTVILRIQAVPNIWPFFYSNWLSLEPNLLRRYFSSAKILINTCHLPALSFPFSHIYLVSP